MRDQTLLGINIGLALLAATLTGGALYIASVTDQTHLGSYLTSSIVRIGAAFLFALSGILALSFHTLRRPILTGQALCLGAAALWLLLWGLWLFLGGHSSGKISWSPGILTAICLWAAYLVRQTLLLPRLPNSVIAKRFHWYVTGFAGAIDIGMFIKGFLMFMHLWKGDFPQG